MKRTLIGLAACAAISGCESSESTVEKSEHASSVAVPMLLDAPEPSIDPLDHPDWEAIVLDAAMRYPTEYGQVTSFGWIPTQCREPLVGERWIERDKQHNELLPDDHKGPGKIGVLFAKDAENYLHDPKGAGASVGQTIVKRAYEAVPFDPKSTDHEGIDVLAGPRAVADAVEGMFREDIYTPGELTGLFVMHRLDPDTPGTDRGWIYATLTRPGFVDSPAVGTWKVTAVGKIDSCVGCHQATGPNRLFGAGDRAVNPPLFYKANGDLR